MTCISVLLRTSPGAWNLDYEPAFTGSADCSRNFCWMSIATDSSLLFKVPLVLQASNRGTQWSWQESNSSSPAQKSKKTSAVLKDTALLGNWDNELTRADFSLLLFSRTVSNKIWQAEKSPLGEERQRGRAEIHRVSLKRQSFAHSCSPWLMEKYWTSDKNVGMCLVSDLHKNLNAVCIHVRNKERLSRLPSCVKKITAVIAISL